MSVIVINIVMSIQTYNFYNTMGGDDIHAMFWVEKGMA